MAFSVTKFPRVDEQIKVLAKRAAAMGQFAQFANAIDRVNEHLESDPMGWGDPRYHTKHPGGVVCHGFEAPLLVHFAAYEAEQVVCLIDIQPWPSSPLAVTDS